MPSGFVQFQTNRTPEFLSKFPLGKIPALETADGFHLVESSAIAFYVAEMGPRKDQLLGTTPEHRALVHQWVFFTSEQLNHTILNLVRPHLGFQEYVAAVEEENASNLKRWLEYMEQHLKERTWFVDGKDGRKEEGPSLADVSVGQSLRFLLKFWLDEEGRAPYPKVMAWWERLIAVPEVEQGFGGNALLKKRGTI